MCIRSWTCPKCASTWIGNARRTFGLTQRDVANNLLISLASSGQAFPNYWLDPKNGVSYLVAVQTPQYHINTWTRCKTRR